MPHKTPRLCSLPLAPTPLREREREQARLHTHTTLLPFNCEWYLLVAPTVDCPQGLPFLTSEPLHWPPICLPLPPGVLIIPKAHPGPADRLIGPPCAPGPALCFGGRCSQTARTTQGSGSASPLVGPGPSSLLQLWGSDSHPKALLCSVSLLSGTEGE